MFKKLKMKFIIMNMLTISLLVLGAFGVIYTMTYQNIEKENETKILNVATGNSVDLRYNQSFNFNDDRLTGSIPSNYSLSFSVILDENNSLINIQSYVDLPIGFIQRATNEALFDEKEAGKFKLNGKTWMYKMDDSGSMGFTEGSGMGSVIYIQDTKRISFLDITDSEQVLSQLLISLSVLGSIMIFLILLLSIYFSKRAVAPVEAAYDAQKKFLEDASHELKTPIAAVIANTEAVLSNSNETVGSQEQWLKHIKDESARMSQLVNGLLYLSRSEYEEDTLEISELDYSKLVSDLVLSVEALVFERGFNLNTDVDEGILLKSDGGRIKQIIRILLDNALKYTNEKGTIEMKLKNNEDSVEFVLSNTGEGIPEEDISKVFDRFYRVNKARTGDGSYGIGLSIASVLVNELGGKLKVESIENEITTFTFKL